MYYAIGRSENKIIMQSKLFENETGLGVLQSRVQQTQALEEHQKHKPCTTDYVSIRSMLCEIFADCMFVERYTGALQVQPRFQNT